MRPALDLDAELAAGQETGLREIEPAGKSPAPVLDLSEIAAHKSDPKVLGLLRRALRSMDGEPAKSARLCLKAVSLAPDLPVANQAMALALEKLGRLSKALEFYERAWRLDPDNPDIYSSLAMAAWKLDMLDAAEKFLRLQQQLKPGCPNGIINLAGVLRDKGRYADSVELLRAAIYAAPETPELWNALGTTLMDSGEPEQSLTFYEEALRLRPGFARAHHNMAYALELKGDPEAAIPHFEAALDAPASEQDKVVSSHGYAHTLLAAGRIAKGWEWYEWRRNMHYRYATNFLIPGRSWNGMDAGELAGRTVSVVGEQGLGDEVLFANILPDVIEAVGSEGEVRIACEKRLVPLFARSFPTARVCRHYTIEREGRQHRSAPDLVKDGEHDMWAPVGSLMRAFRPDADSFPDRSAFLVPDEARVEAFREQLAGYGPGLKIGLLWKSLKMDATRSKHFAAFDLWAPVLKTPGACFVNLQYGDTAQDIAAAEKRFGVRIHTPEGLDLKDDLDGVAAMGKACDLVLGPMNATTNLAAAAGGNVWFLRPTLIAWAMLGQSEMLWYPRSRTFAGRFYRDWAGAMAALSEALQAHIEERTAA
ncbi:tetratricopeptide repeat protein [Alkalicaulis satelles]|uniref:Tetratricopeptide repeat protein n=1 Tax=Alkalicaulis satelles TaxID=2609175 RepID=A0A5M6ZD52_9PROT|nr:tetratricopeptide repeat protein [Alkalicaulis satelles]KAA5802245.1 tetratricopeptide repeat protein [Alkalicaulis satelles]